LNKKEKKSIMVIDDEPDITLTLKTTLEESGLFDVYKFNDPHQALSTFKPGMYDLLILDIRMQDMNGFELLREVRKIDNKVKVCFLTALSELREYESTIGQVCPELDEDHFIKKPVDHVELVGRINHILRSNQEITRS
jgi:two-component system, OmpR family, response regulator ChvI